MNSILHHPDPLPTVLRQSPANGLRRRQRIGEYRIDHDALRHFNMLLQRLHLRQAPLECDQVASAARELVDRSREGQAPRCIQQRMRRAAAINVMAEDPDWEVAYAAALRAELVVIDYLRGGFDLIPRTVRVVGRLDDAILVDAAWPSLAAEVRDYVAFRRLRQVEAMLRGENRTHFGFTRKQYQDAALAEAAWIAHCERVDQLSYLPRDATLAFRIH